MDDKIVPVIFDNITILRGSKYIGLWEWEGCCFKDKTATIKIKNTHKDFADVKNTWEVGTCYIEPLNKDGEPNKGVIKIELSIDETSLLAIPEDETFQYDDDGGYYSVLNIFLDDEIVILSANIKVVNSLGALDIDYLNYDKDSAILIYKKLKFIQKQYDELINDKTKIIDEIIKNSLLEYNNNHQEKLQTLEKQNQEAKDKLDELDNKIDEFLKNNLITLKDVYQAIYDVIDNDVEDKISTINKALDDTNNKITYIEKTTNTNILFVSDYYEIPPNTTIEVKEALIVGYETSCKAENIEIAEYRDFSIPNPKGRWLFCDGREISRLKYKKLFDCIGTRYGKGDGYTTFNIPNLQGMFKRTIDENRKYDKDKRSLGSFQGDSIRNIKGHTGLVDYRQDGYYSGAFYTIHNTSSHNANVYAKKSCFDLYFDASKVVPTSHENRPVNISVYTCIAY